MGVNFSHYVELGNSALPEVVSDRDHISSSLWYIFSFYSDTRNWDSKVILLLTLVCVPLNNCSPWLLFIVLDFNHKSILRSFDCKSSFMRYVCYHRKIIMANYIVVLRLKLMCFYVGHFILDWKGQIVPHLCFHYKIW